MLQQTQVARVIPKFEAFISRFPDVHSLAAASLGEVLELWQGLGYNRRAKFLWQAAQHVVNERGGEFPDQRADLLQLPGVGANTAGAILAYAYNQPSVFIETNIRTVYIHHFFTDLPAVTDGDIAQKLQATLDYEQPRTFYWALMDYGTHLKAQGVTTHLRSRHYKKQSKLEGSVRQVRGQIVKVLAEKTAVADRELQRLVSADHRYEPALEGLIKDGMAQRYEGRTSLGSDQSIDKK